MNNKLKIVAGLLVVLGCLVLGITKLNARDELVVVDSLDETASSDEVVSTLEEVSVDSQIILEDATVSLETGNMVKSDGSSDAAEAKCAISKIVVHVCGAVVTPGVYELSQDARVYEAIEAAGGFTEGASDDYLNLADIILDGSRIYVPTKAELTATENISVNEVYGVSEPVNISENASKAFENVTGTKSDTMAKVNLNTASKEELMSLRGIGEAKALAIIEYRTTVGAFKTIEDVMNITGIKEGMFNKIKDSITV